MHRTDPTDRPKAREKSGYDFADMTLGMTRDMTFSEDGIRNMTRSTRAQGWSVSRGIVVGLGVGKKVGV